MGKLPITPNHQPGKLEPGEDLEERIELKDGEGRDEHQRRGAGRSCDLLLEQFMYAEGWLVLYLSVVPLEQDLAPLVVSQQ